MDIEVARRSFTVDEYYRMAEAGILEEDDRVELLDGEIVEMEPIGSRHAACVDRLTHLAVERAGEDALVRIQNPVRLGELSEPEPDLALVEPRPDGYAGSHPGPGDVLLVVEVAQTSAGPDRRLKLPLYAAAGVPEVWLVDLREDRVELFRDPESKGYRDRRTAAPGEELRPRRLPAFRVTVEEMLPG